MKFLFSSFAFFCVFSLCAQLEDNFSDGNFSENPAWIGDTALFVVNPTGCLQLNAPEAGIARLFTPVVFPDSIRWELQFKLDFAPSASNQFRFWLQAEEVPSVQNGCFVAIGENGTLDALQFYERKNGQDVLLTTGMVGVFGAEPVEGTLKVRVNNQGVWNVEFITSTGAISTFQVLLPQLMLSSSGYLGFECLFTTTRKDKFFFNRVSMSPDVPDTRAPTLLSCTAIQSRLLELKFDEPLEEALTKTHLVWSVNDAAIAGTIAVEGSSVRINLEEDLEDDHWYSISVRGATDLSGNSSLEETEEIYVLIGKIASPGKLIFTELMADPSPTVGLPEDVEWLELHNRSSDFLQLGGLQIKDGGGAICTLTSGILPPGGYLAICESGFETKLKTAENTVIGISGFPSLTNSGEQIQLINAQEELLDQVVYSDSWYKDASKREGGWSLERIHLSRDCLGSQNWAACRTLPGGTPGKVNSSAYDSISWTRPVLRQLELIDPKTLLLAFSNGMDPSLLQKPDLFTIQPPIALSRIEWNSEQPERIVFHFLEALPSSQLFHLKASHNLVDCIGQPFSPILEVSFGLPEPVEKGTLLLNELLFDPFPGEGRFIEIVNVGSKIASLKSLFVADLQRGSSLHALPSNQFLLPGEYLVLAPDPASLLIRYPNGKPNQLVQMPLPSLDATEGNVSLVFSSGSEVEIIDSFSYHAQMHNALLGASQREGVSLERIRWEVPASETANWTSGSSYGSPTLPNSQQRAPLQVDGSAFKALSNRISPDGDGWEDIWELQYQMPGPNFWLNAIIYNLEGAPIRQWVWQQRLSSEGILRWEGETEQGEPAQPGIYIISLECFNPEGSIIREKVVVSVRIKA